MPSFPAKEAKRLNPNAEPYSRKPSLQKAEFLRPPPPVTARLQLVSHVFPPNTWCRTAVYVQQYPAVSRYDANDFAFVTHADGVLGGGGGGREDAGRSSRWMKRRNVSGGPCAAKRWLPVKRVRPQSKKCQSPGKVKTTTMGSASTGDNDLNTVIPFPMDDLELERAGTTTVMIKNIPNQFRRRDLLRMLARHCRIENRKAWLRCEPRTSEFDFVYLPMDFRKFWFYGKVANLGYAFVNFTSTSAASLFYKYYHLREWGVLQCNKICEVTCAKVQGRDALRKSLEDKIFHCHTDEYLPLSVEPPCDGTFFPGGSTVGRRVEKIPRHPIRKS